MMIQNNLQNRLRFFALYWGLNILYVNKIVYPYEVGTNHIYRGDYLELKDIKDISDEDAIEVARLCLDPKEKPLEVVEIINWDWLKKIIVNREPSLTDKDTIIEMYISFNFEDAEVKFTWDYNNSKGSGQLERHLPNASRAYDYLRSKGYALPWLGLSVEQQIEYGWIKIITQC